MSVQCSERQSRLDGRRRNVQLLDKRTYAGVAGETVTVSTDVAGGGAVTVMIDGAPTAEDPVFALKSNPGDETHMSILLVGAVGDSCVVNISEVNGASDGDLLLCQSLDPAPIHRYRFIVVAPAAIRALEAARQPVRRARPAGRRSGAAPKRK
jgi:hypothetical protein